MEEGNHIWCFHLYSPIFHILSFCRLSKWNLHFIFHNPWLVFLTWVCPVFLHTRLKFPLLQYQKRCSTAYLGIITITFFDFFWTWNFSSFICFPWKRHWRASPFLLCLWQLGFYEPTSFLLKVLRISVTCLYLAMVECIIMAVPGGISIHAWSQILAEIIDRYDSQESFWYRDT